MTDNLKRSKRNSKSSGARRHLAIYTTLLATGVLPGAVHADPVSWNNPAGGDFALPANWSTGNVPTSSDDSIFSLSSATPYSVTFSTFSSATVNSLTVGTDNVAFQLSPAAGFSSSATTIGDVSGSIAQLTLDGPGSLSLGTTVVGDQAGSSGTLLYGTLDPSFNSAFIDTLTIGNAGAGTFQMSSQSLQTNAVIVGAQDGATGTVSVTNGNWNASSLTLGNATNAVGNDTLTISGGNFTSSGAAAINTSGLLTMNSGRLEAASIAGTSGALAFNAGTIVVHSDVTLDGSGVFGSSLIMANGMSLTVNNLDVPLNSSVSMNGGSLTASAITREGAIDFSSGAVSMTASDIVIDPGATGTFSSGNITLNSNDVLQAINGAITVGDTGNASLTLQGGAATAHDANIAAQSGTSSILLSAGGSLDATSQLVVGGLATFAGGSAAGGVATLTVGSSAAVTADSLTIYPASQVILSGGSLTTNTLVAGGVNGLIAFNSGSITVNNTSVTIGTGGAIPNGFTLGFSDAAFFNAGTTLNDQGIVINGGQFKTTGVARTGSGQITLNSGLVSITAGDAVIGAASNPAATIAPTVVLNSNGHLQVSGTTDVLAGGSLTINGGTLTTSRLQVEGSFTFTTGTLTDAQDDLVIDNSGTAKPPYYLGASPTITSNGNVSSLVAFANVTVGATGTGSVLIRNGSALNATGNFIIGDTSTGQGTVTAGTTSFATGGAIHADQLIVGNHGTGTLNFVGGLVQSTGLSIGALPGSSGHLNLTSYAEMSATELVVGGTYTTSGSQIVTTPGGSAAISITGISSLGAANMKMYSGSIQINGNNPTDLLFSFTHTAEIDKFATIDVTNGSFDAKDINNAGTITIHNGGRVNVTGTYTQLATGKLDVLAGGIFDPPAIDNAGTFSGTGTINATSLINTGIIAPGDDAAEHPFGDLTLASNVDLDTGSELQIALGGEDPATQYDQLLITGNATLGGLLELNFADSFQSSILPTDTFTILTSPTTLAGSFDDVTNGQRLETTDGLGSFVVNYGPQSAFNPDNVVLSNFQPTSVPEPSMMTMISLGLLIPIRRHRRWR